MSSPPIPYDRQAHLGGFSTEQFPTVGQDLEAEFNRVGAAMGTTQQRLAEIQRDDGRLKNLSVHPDALSDQVRAMLGTAGGNPRGAWATGVNYAIKDIVSNGNGSYLAAVAHTAGADFDDDLAAGYWLLLAGGTAATSDVFEVPVTIAPTSGDSVLNLDASIAANRSAINGKKAGAMRWQLVLGSNDTETGANAGSSAVLYRYSDTGVPSVVWTINRATGQVTFASRPLFAGNTPWDSGNFDPNAYLPKAGGTVTGATTFTADDNKFTGQAPLQFTGTGASGTVYFHGLNGAGDDMVAVTRVGASNYTWAFKGLIEGSDAKATSDERLKSEIQPLRRGLRELKRMRARQYVKDGRREIGFIAQEAQRAIPEAIGENADGYLTLSYGQATALVANAVLQLERRLMVTTGIAAAAIVTAVLAWI